MPPKEKEDPEALMRRQFLAKCRFRALVRKVIENLYWLTEDEEVYEGDNVKKRVEQAMRAKSKKKTLLSLTDKALLNKPVSERTEAEKRYIYRKIGGLKCFKRYPNHVKRKLAAATYFKYYGPNRVIVRQNQEAHALYFVVTGEVTVSILIYDELLKKHISINVFVMHSGDMFGEVSLLHNIKRTATCTTSGHCEFLALMTEDFKEVLQKSLQKQWDEVQVAMSSFTYFDGLDAVARREGCIVAKMKSYDPDETILGDGVGMNNCVYFVLSGSCKMIESLNIITKEILGKKFYSLYDPYVEKKEELDFHNKYFKNLSEVDKTKTASNIASTNKESENIDVDKTKTSSNIASTNKESENIDVDKTKTSSNIVSTSKGSENIDDITKSKEKVFRLSHDPNKSGGEIRRRIESVSKYDLVSRKSVGVKVSRTTISSKRRANPLLKQECSDEAIELSKVLLQPSRDSHERASVRIAPKFSSDQIRTYFMQVCIFNAGSTFGFGENMRDRRIVAMTRVDCMVLPLVWLLQKNTANIWSRIKHYLEKKIPTKKQLFQHFVEQRRWLEWRDSLVAEIVSRSNTVNHTTIHDVPYSIRMQEMPDI